MSNHTTSLILAAIASFFLPGRALSQTVVVPPLERPGFYSTLSPKTDYAEEHLRGPSFGAPRGGLKAPAKAPLMVTFGDLITSPGPFLSRLPAEPFRCLVLNGTTIQDKDMAQVARLKNLRRLELNNTDITDKGLAQIASLTQLEYLDVSHTKINGTFLAKLSGLKQLRALKMHGNNIDTTSLVALKQFNKLALLFVSQCHLRNPDLKMIGENHELTDLAIGEDPLISDKGMPELKPLHKLASLNVAETQVTSRGLLTLKGLPITDIKVTPTALTAAERNNLQKVFPRLSFRFDDSRNKSLTIYKEMFE
ncbi:MAG: hypothetical protein JSS83_04880 [Cyanobacteria bacterium SZAS LIN-3]|nr:hypothetical protein [Cyanobacteria bacterium SZAS LIN-3]